MRSAQFSIFPSCILHGNTAFIRLFKILTAKRTLQSKSFILATFTSKPFGSKLWNLPLCYARGNTSHILVMIVIALPFSTFLWAVHFSTTHNVIGFLRTSVTISPQCRNSRLSYEENLGYFDRRACFNSSALTTSPQNIYHQCIYM